MTEALRRICGVWCTIISHRLWREAGKGPHTRAIGPTHAAKANMHPNLALRPAKPALLNGRVQRLARNALIALGEASTSQILRWTCGMKLHQGGRIANHDDRSARRALDQIGAVRVGRATTIGRPFIWTLAPLDMVDKAANRGPI